MADCCPVTPVLDTVVNDCSTDLDVDIVVDDIVATIGPLVDGVDVLIELLSNGDVTELEPLALGVESNGNERTSFVVTILDTFELLELLLLKYVNTFFVSFLVFV